LEEKKKNKNSINFQILTSSKSITESGFSPQHFSKNLSQKLFFILSTASVALLSSFVFDPFFFSYKNISLVTNTLLYCKSGSLSEIGHLIKKIILYFYFKKLKN